MKKSKPKHWTAVLALVACIMGPLHTTTAWAGGPPYQPLPKFGIEPGAPFPADGLLDPAGQPFALEPLRGKPVLINFFAKFCAPCIKEVPQLNQVKARRTDFHMLAITLDSRADAADYVKNHGLRWQVAANGADLMLNRLRVMAFPAFALLDRDGHLLATVMGNQLGAADGHATAEGIEAWVDLQLGKKLK
ncbi:thiol-disulfide isomerase/thioredoxin [Paucibacter oligotrophus]|uniref:Thiol-disulfide isomerase/thioredoxin n=1 Tax=Roseateles oligotrophus TaxID=1769250 RepID=A0A840LGI7_9BURK|nr:TlpA disulfide reductase family protein [Roseateles oligotrophus]MBB4845733.1 thiol-disulfide isomerase/thioredoxin [Roseateles oligotrophus]